MIIYVGITSISYVPITLEANTFDLLLAGNISLMILCLLLSLQIYAPKTGIFLFEINDRWGQRIRIYLFGFAPKDIVERALLAGRVFEAFLSYTADRYKRFYILFGGGLILGGSWKCWTLTLPTNGGPPLIIVYLSEFFISTFCWGMGWGIYWTSANFTTSIDGEVGILTGVLIFGRDGIKTF